MKYHQQLNVLGIQLYSFLEKNKVLFVYLPLTVYWIVIFILTSIPAESVPTVGISDKLQHLLAYCVLAMLLYLTLIIQNKFPLLKRNAITFSIIILIGYGVLDELHQLLIPGRSGEVMDVVADVVGGIIGLIIVRLIVLNHKAQESVAP